MKKQNLWRVLTLALALVMLFSVVACGNEEEPVATTEEAADGTTGTTATAATTQKPATTEKPTTATTQKTDPPADPKPDPKVYSGTPDTTWYDATKTEFTLTTADQVIGFFELRSKDTSFAGMTVKMATDVVYNAGTVEEIKANEGRHSWYVLNSNYLFQGTFDGQGHTFSGFAFVASGSLTRGMFGSTGEGAVIKNLVMKNAYFKGPEVEKNTFGLLVSRVRGLNAVIENVTVTDALFEEGDGSISMIGGLVGRVDQEGTITIKNCTVDADITVSAGSVGGMIGAVNSTSSATIIECRNLGNITGATCVGGMVGFKSEEATVNITYCGNFGTLTATAADGTAAPLIGSHPEAPKTFTFVDEHFTATKPEALNAADVITLAGADATGFGIHALEQKYDNDAVKITHYYLETSDTEIAKLKLEDGTPAKKSDFYMTWEFTVAEEGDYDIYFNLRLKDNKARENILLVDGADPIYMSYDFTCYGTDIFNVMGFGDAYQNTYVSGAYVHLKEGKHTLTMKISDDTASSFHFRNVYVVKQTPIMVPQFGVENFSKEIPTIFTTAEAIKLDCTMLDAGVTYWDNQSTTNHRLNTEYDVGAPSANGIVKLKIDGYYHYYVEPMWWTNYTSLYPLYMRWTVEIPEDGLYNVCFQFRLKNDDQRYTQIQIDDAPVKEQYALTYKVTGNASLKDSVQNSYMTGWSVYLTAGTHTITARMPDYTKDFKAATDNSCPSFHFRHIYLIKADIAG